MRRNVQGGCASLLVSNRHEERICRSLCCVQPSARPDKPSHCVGSRHVVRLCSVIPHGTERRAISQMAGSQAHMTYPLRHHGAAVPTPRCARSLGAESSMRRQYKGRSDVSPSASPSLEPLTLSYGFNYQPIPPREGRQGGRSSAVRRSTVSGRGFSGAGSGAQEAGSPPPLPPLHGLYTPSRGCFPYLRKT